jgi:hypothetical protein
MRTLRPTLLLSALLFVALPVKAQNCLDGVFYTPPGFQEDDWLFPWRDHFTPLTRLGNHFMTTFGDGDSMTESVAQDMASNDAEWLGSEGLHETWYVPRDQGIAGTGPLYRHYSPQLGDHLDAPTQSDGSLGYYTEFVHGYPWNTEASGTSPITRYLNGSIFDHRTWLPLPDSPPGYALDSTFSVAEAGANARYGYKRHGNCLGRDSVLATAYRDSLNNGYLRVDFNHVWGNAIGRITHTPTATQLVIEGDIGALVQSSVFHALAGIEDARAARGQGCCLINPTEAGGAHLFDYGNTRLWAGSPILSTAYAGSSPRSLTTVLKPFNFITDIGHDSFGNTTDRYSPLLWRGTFRKTTTLGYSTGGTVYADVLKIVLEAKLDADGPNVNPYVMHNIFWLRPTRANTALPLTAVQGLNFRTGVATPLLRDQDSFTDPDSALIGVVDGSLTMGFWRVDRPGLPLASFDYTRNPATKDFIVGNNVFHNLNKSAYESETSILVVASPNEVTMRLKQIACQETGRCATGPAPTRFYTLTPCRVADTRNPEGPYGGPSLATGSKRDFQMSGACGIPGGVRSVALNVTVTGSSADGRLVLYPGGAPVPLAQSISYRASQTRASIAIPLLSASGKLGVLSCPGAATSLPCVQSTGAADVIIDVTGYFQ